MRQVECGRKEAFIIKQYFLSILETSLWGRLKAENEYFHLVREDSNEDVTFFGDHCFFVFPRTSYDRSIVDTSTKFTILLHSINALEGSGFVALKNLVQFV